jgi:hypothetical protein
MFEERLFIYQKSAYFSIIQRERQIGLDDIYFLGAWFGDSLLNVMLQHLQQGKSFCESSLCIVSDPTLLTTKEEISRFNTWFLEHLNIIEEEK